MNERLLHLADLGPEELDEMPIGAIVIEPDGKIVKYNQYEARLARKDQKSVIGKNFFRDVAPCTGVKAFEGRMRTFLKTKETVSESFDYFFPFSFGAVNVVITFVKLPGNREILIAVERKDSFPAS